ncbi:hypothetical protein Godav_012698 [Gossypium davidsonii]|uniref:Uncharacterized protein n=2 Tax=Gossypium TaxID=3633 RepID=A0A7J8REN9_GOSDV|nr:hypothetical protein [Gossypium davidsonii]
MAASASSSSSSSSSSTTKTIPARKRGWLSNISSISSRVYFFLIFLQIPLFRVDFWGLAIVIRIGQLVRAFKVVLKVLHGSKYHGMERNSALATEEAIVSNSMSIGYGTQDMESFRMSYGYLVFVPENAILAFISEMRNGTKIPCRSGMCSTPIHVTSSQLIASDIFPVPVVKAILFPGAITNGLAKNWTVPSWDNLLNMYNLTSIKESSALPDLQRLEVLAGSYFCVAGALVGLLKPGRMSMFGTLLIIWGLVKEGIIGKPANTDLTKAVYVYPTMVLALICALSSIKYDVKKVMRTAPARPIAKPLQSSSKSKLK